jgi:hypothetical protein
MVHIYRIVPETSSKVAAKRPAVNENLNGSTNFSKALQYQISKQSIHSFSSCAKRADRWME